MILLVDTSISLIKRLFSNTLSYSNMGQKIRHLNKLKEENNKLKAEKNKAMEDLTKAIEQKDKLQKVFFLIRSNINSISRDLMKHKIQILIQEVSLMVQEIV